MADTEDIKEPTREALDREFFRRIQRLSTWTVIFHQALSVQVGLNPTDLKCRGLLAETGPITAGELAELTGLTTAAITGVIDRLERLGLVRRAKDPSDRRRVVVEPLENPQHRRPIEEGFGPLARSTATLIEGYDDEQLRFILEFIDRSAVLMKTQTSELRAARAARGASRTNEQS